MKKFVAVYYKILPYYCGALLAFSLYELYDSLMGGNRDRIAAYIILSAAFAVGLISGIIISVCSRNKKKADNSSCPASKST